MDAWAALLSEVSLPRPGTTHKQLFSGTYCVSVSCAPSDQQQAVPVIPRKTLKDRHICDRVSSIVRLDKTLG